MFSLSIQQWKDNKTGTDSHNHNDEERNFLAVMNSPEVNMVVQVSAE